MRIAASPIKDLGLQRLRVSTKGTMIKITRAKNAKVVLKVSGRMNSENTAELKAMIKAEEREQRMVLDLEELTLVDEDSVLFLVGCEADGIELKNCPPYIREWITSQRARS